MMRKSDFNVGQYIQFVLGVAMLLCVVFPIWPILAQSAPSAEDKVRSAAITALREAAGNEATISISPATGRVRFVRFAPGSLRAATPTEPAAEQAAHFLAEFGAAFGLHDPAQELQERSLTTDYLGATHVTYDQFYQGVPVFAATLQVHFDAAGQIIAANGVIIPDLKLVVEPTLSQNAAAEIAQRHVSAALPPNHGAPQPLWAVVQQLTILRSGLIQGVAGVDHLVYEVLVTADDPTVREFVYVDAHTGEIVEQFSAIHSALDRRVYNNTSSFDPTNLVWQEGDALPYTNVDPSLQANINGIIAYSEDTYNFFAGLSGGDFLSWNGADAAMSSFYAPPGARCPNANWTGQGVTFCPDVVSDDLVGHEWAHGYTQATDQLIYQWQPGALNEAYSDIWGETIDLINGAGTDAPNTPRTDGACTLFTHANGTDNSRRWLAFEDARGYGQALRDLWNPTCFGNPGKVSDTQYFCGSGDDGGVHSNSGVANHAYALLVDGGVYNGQSISGIGLTRAANIYWRAQSVYQGRITDFADHADALEQSCSDLIGAPIYALDTDDPLPTIASEKIRAADCAELSKAISAVELRSEPTQCRFAPLLNTNTPALCLNEGPTVSLFTQDWEGGLADWAVGTRAVFSTATFSTADWAVVDALPDGRSGQAAFVANENTGSEYNQTGILFLESPAIALPLDALVPRLAFDHWFALEASRDGGNVKISVNDGPWTLVPQSAFPFNPYNGQVFSDGVVENAFTGTNYATYDDGSWGQSQVNLSGLARGGDRIRLRFDLHLNANGGVQGWYVDEVQAYYCQSCGNGQLNEGELCDDGNLAAGDGCSSLCQLEIGWFCKAPVTALGSRESEPSRCINLAQAACVDADLAIPDNDSTGVTSTMNITSGVLSTTATLLDLDVYVEAEHTWLGDLSFVLEKAASGRQAILLDRPGSQTPGAFGCSGDDMAALFDDESVLPAEFSCSSSTVPALAGNFNNGNGPGASLSVFAGDEWAGEWRLTVADHAVNELGSLTRWCLVPTTVQSSSADQQLFLPLVGG